METEISIIASKLEMMAAGTLAMDSGVPASELITALENADISPDVLSKTRIGLILNDFRKKTSDDKLAKRSKQLIKLWKNKVEVIGASKPPAKIDSQSRKKSSTTTPPIENNEAKKARIEPSSLKPKPETSNNIKMPRNLNRPSDEVRSRNVDIISKSLTSGELPEHSLNPEDVAIEVEAAIFELHGDSERYTSTIRSRVFNLRDKKNPALRENVILGNLTAATFAKMSAEEMASSDMKKMREAFHKEAINEHQMGVQEGTPSDMFKCGKCGKYNCTYNQVQTRSADEPMTTFVFCRECGNRWKFC